jgi:hypothetical protein
VYVLCHACSEAVFTVGIVWQWCMQGLTIDSRMSEAAPPRIIKGKRVDDIVAFYEEYRATQRGEL